MTGAPESCNFSGPHHPPPAAREESILLLHPLHRPSSRKPPIPAITSVVLEHQGSCWVASVMILKTCSVPIAFESTDGRHPGSPTLGHMTARHGREEDVRSLMRDPPTPSRGGKAYIFDDDRSARPLLHSLPASAGYESPISSSKARVRVATPKTDLMTGISERIAQGDRDRENATLRRLHGCDVYSMSGVSSFTARKNRASSKSASAGEDRPRTAGKAGVGGQHSWHNPVVAPQSAEKGGSSRRKSAGRNMHASSAQNLIIEPPPEQPARQVRGGDPYGRHLRQSVHKPRDHGDIISGRDQKPLAGTGKRRTEYGRAIADHGTLTMLHWGQEAVGRPPTSHRNNSSEQVAAAFGGGSRPQTAPQGQTSIDRLAIGLAFAVSAPRNNVAGGGFADLQR